MQRFKIQCMGLLALFFQLSQTATICGQDFQWAYAIEGPGNDFIYDLDVIQNEWLLATGCVTNQADLDLLNGIETAVITDLYSPFIAKYDAIANLQYYAILGGKGSVQQAVILDDFSFVLAGHGEGAMYLDPQNTLSPTLIPNEQNQDIFISRYDENYNLQWALTIGGTGIDTVSTLLLGDDNLLYLYGQFTGQMTLDINGIETTFSTWDYLQSNDTNTSDVFVLTLTSDGIPTQCVHVGSLGQDHANGCDQQQNLLALTGRSSGQMYWMNDTNISVYDTAENFNTFLICADVQGDMLWSRFNCNDFIQNEMYDVAFTSNQVKAVGRYAGWLDFDESDAMEGQGSLNSADAFYASFDLNGTVLNTYQMAGQQRDESYAIRVFSDDEIMILSHQGGSANFGINDNFAVGASGIFTSQMMVYNAQGDVMSGQTWSTDTYSEVHEVVRINNNYFVAMEFDGTLYVDNQSGETITTTANTDALLLKYGVCLQPIVPEIILSTDTICRYDSLTFSLVGGSLNGASDWGWYFNFEPPVPFNGSNSVTVSPFYTGTLKVEGIGGCVSNSDVAWSPYFTVLNDPGGSINTWNFSNEPCDFNAQYSADLIGPTITYTWEPPVSTTYNALGLCEGIYYFTASLENGCAFYDTLIFETIGLEEIGSSEMEVVFLRNNPIHDQAILEVTIQEHVHCCLYDMTGKMVNTSTLQYGRNEMDWSNLPTGTYFLQWFDRKQTGFLKVIKT
jgi:Secretion system C-terminal sorting domain